MTKYKLLILILFCAFWIGLSNCNTPKTCMKKKELSHEKEEDEKTGAQQAIEQEIQKTRDPNLGYVPTEELYKAFAQRQNQKYQINAAIPGITWKERGPDNVGGRTRAVLFDLNDPTHKTVFAGGVGGGLWKCTNIYAAVPTWTKVNDLYDNLAITCIAQDPVRPDTIYFGTGEGFFNADAIRGGGVWKSTNGGSSFTQLSATLPSSTNYAFDYIQKIVVLANANVLVATRSFTYCNYGGIYRSTNAGSSFSSVLTGTGTGCGGGPLQKGNDIEVAADGVVYATMGLSNSDGIYRSKDNGANWFRIYASASDEYRIDIACAPSDKNYIYALVQKSDYTVKKIMRTTNSRDTSVTWSTLGNVSWKDQCAGTATSDFSRQQAYYDLAIGVPYRYKDTAFIGGVDLFKTNNGGTSWSQISAWTGCGGFAFVHADQHAFVFRNKSKDTALIVNDGGIYLTTNASVSAPTFTPKSKNYNTSQFYSVAMHPGRYSNTFIGGLQDNGTQLFTQPGINATEEVNGGDGGFCHIDQTNGNYQFSTYTYQNVYRTTNNWLTKSAISTSGSGKFINPLDYDNANQRMYFGNGTSGYKIINNTRGTTSISTIGLTMTGAVSAVTVDNSVNNRVWIGTDGGKLYRVTSAHSSPSYSDVSSSSWGSWYLNCIAQDLKNSDHLLVVFSNYGIDNIWETKNASASTPTWTSVDNSSLPNIPVRWALFSPLGGDSAMIATEMGVYSTDNLNGTSTSWGTSASGLANTRIDMLKFRPSDSLVIAATHGRGLFTSDIFTKIKVDFGANTQLVYTGDVIQFYDDSYKATSWAWDFDNNGSTDATTQNPTWTYSSDGMKTVKLTINGSKSITKPAFVQVLPNMSVPYNLSDGGNFEDSTKAFHFGSKILEGTINLWERGVPSNVINNTASGTKVWKTDLDANIAEASYKNALYSPRFNFTASGTYKVRFKYRADIYYSNAPFAMWMEYSTDGTNWSKLGNTTSGDSGWYNASAHVVPSDGICWSNADITSWKVAKHDVSSLAGNSKVMFRVVAQCVYGYPSIGYGIDGYAIDDFSVSGPTSLSISHTATDVKCNGGSDGAVNITVSGGTTPYTYSWSNSSTTEDISSLKAGTYIVTVTDKNSLTIKDTAIVKEPSKLSKSHNITHVNCNGGSDGKVDVTISGGTTPYTYSWSNSSTSEDLNAIAAGTFYLTVMDKNGCVIKDTAVVTEPSKLTKSKTVTDAKCKNGTDGNIDISIGGGTTAYSYSWSNSATTEDLNNIGAGTYYVVVTDKNGCIIRDTAIVKEPSALAKSDSITHVKCNGGSDGAVNETITGGTTPYSYSWSNSSSTEDISTLTAGTYYLTVTDKNGCIVKDTSIVTQPSKLSKSHTITDVKCKNGTDGKVDVTISGGTTAYTYSWSNSATTEDLNNIGPGTYTLLATDKNGCTIRDTAIVKEPFALSKSHTITDTKCFNGNDGAINVTISGGTTSYTYSWSNSAITEDLTSITAGTYILLVTDKNGCTIRDTAIVKQPSALTKSHTITHVKCNGGNTGAIDVTISGGTPGYTFSWSNSATTEDISTLSAGTYILTATDKNGCIIKDTSVVTQPSVISISRTISHVKCFGGNDGKIDITVNGGTSPFKFAWGSGDTTEDISGLTAKTYLLIVFDKNGCTAWDSFTVSQPSVLKKTHTISHAKCNGDKNGSVDLTISGGKKPYTFSWSNSATTEDISGVQAGTYIVEIRDSNNCIIRDTAVINQPAQLVITNSMTPISCFGGNNGAVNITVSGGTGPYNYSWNNSSTNEDLNNLTTGQYIVTVMDKNGCTIKDTADIVQPSKINISHTVNHVKCFNGNTGDINVTVSGGTNPYTYSWSNFANAEDISSLKSGTYYLTVTDKNGCIMRDTAMVTEPSQLIKSHMITNTRCFGENNGAVNLTITGGSTPYSFTWSNSSITEDISGIGKGTYTVTVTDKNSCIIKDTAIVNEPAKLIKSKVITDVKCFGGNDGAVNQTITGGTTPLTFVWSNTNTTEDLTSLIANTYYVVVTDKNGCIIRDTASVKQPAKLDMTFSTINVKCAGGNDGTIDITVTGSTLPYTFLWTNAKTTEDLTGLTEGNYTVKITDANACTLQGSLIPIIATYGLPSKPIITKVGKDSLKSSYPINNQWLKNGADISGATGQYYKMTSTAYYSVKHTDANVCSNTSDTVHFKVSGGINDIPFNNGYKIFPNPAKDKITIQFIKLVTLDIGIYDLVGKQLFETRLNNSKEIIIPLNEFSKGVYNLKIGSENVKIFKE